eukprot:g3874.t1
MAAVHCSVLLVLLLGAPAAFGQLCRGGACPDGVTHAFDAAHAAATFGKTHLWRHTDPMAPEHLHRDNLATVPFNKAGFWWDFTHPAAARSDSTEEAKCDCRPGYHAALDITCRVDKHNRIRVAHPHMKCSGDDLRLRNYNRGTIMLPSQRSPSDVCLHRYWAGTEGVTYHHCKRTGPTTCACCDCKDGHHHRCPAGKHRPSQDDGTCVACPVGRFTGAPNDQASCTACAAGRFQHQAAQTSCTACAAGRFQPAKGKTSCTACAKGRFEDRPGREACRACALGHHQAVEGQTACETCAPGTHADDLGLVVCKACGAETWQDKAGQSACKSAEQCDWDQNCVTDPVASKTAAGDSCEYETKLYTTSSDRVCASHGPCNAKRQYQTKAAHTHDDRQCMRCPEGHHCDGLVKTKCAPGTAHDGSGDDLSFCRFCQPGQYAYGRGWLHCKSCPKGFFEPNKKATGCRECNLGEFADQTGLPNCKLCATGAFAGARGMEACEDCAAGQYQGTAGSSMCHACKMGTVAPLKGTDACEDCAAEKWQDLTGKLTCKDTTKCAAREWESAAYTTSSDRVCLAHSTCDYQHQYHSTPAGGMQDRVCEPLTTCDLEHEYQTKAATTSSDRVCAKLTVCDADEYESVDETPTSDRTCAKISACAAGRYQTQAYTATSDRECADCDAGEYQHLFNALACVKCAAGKLRNSKPAENREVVACSACEPGHYQPEAGKLSCTACAEGK